MRLSTLCISGLLARAFGACTITSTEAAEPTTTTTATATDDTSTTSTTSSTTESATPSVPVVIPGQPIDNGAFESWSTTPRSLLPWTNTSETTGGKVEGVYNVNPCTVGAAYCAGGASVIRVYPPTTAGGYVSAVQKAVIARPSTTYAVSFMFRCLQFDAAHGIDVYYAGDRAGGALCVDAGVAFTRVTAGIQFTTNETGVGELEIRFLNPSGNFVYYYADDFQAKAVE